VEIQGPDQIPPTAAEECAWNAYVTGANGSVTYEWRWDGQAVGSNEYYYPNGPSSGWHLLRLEIWDSYSGDVDSLYVDVDSSYSCI
jgi:hypothetical protein